MRHDTVYSFDVGKTIERFKTCTPDQQSRIEEHIAQVILESFVEPADADYLAARTLAIGGLHRSFFWSAAQAVEKYLKAFLLLNGVSVKKYSHNLSNMMKRAAKIDADFSNFDIKPHANLDPLPNSLSHLDLDEFISHLEIYGSPFNRYNNVGSSYDTGHIFALDSLVYQLRNKMAVPSVEMSFHRRLSSDFQRFLYEANPYFAPSGYDRISLAESIFPLSINSFVPRWEILKKNDSMEFIFPKEWLSKHMKIDWTPNNV